MNILVIGGGISNEREVSLRSSRAVFDAIGMQHAKYFYDWDGDEQWLYDHASEYDVVLPILHGKGGEDGTIQKLLDSVDVRYLGSGVEVSEICIDKQKTQDNLAKHGILVPKFSLLNYEEYKASEYVSGPHVVKPSQGGSSLHTFIITSSGKYSEQEIEDAFIEYGVMMVEEYITGVEITVSVLDGKTLPIIKIVPPEGVFDYENKYNGKTQELCAPTDIPRSLQEQAITLAKTCHDILGCRHLSRVDMIISPDESLYILEVNTMPGMTSQSLFPKAAAYTGLSMAELVEYFIAQVTTTP